MKKLQEYILALGPMAIVSCCYFAGYPIIAVSVAIFLIGLNALLSEAKNELIEAQHDYITILEKPL